MTFCKSRKIKKKCEIKNKKMIKPTGLFDYSSTHTISTSVKIFWTIFRITFPTAPIRLVSKDVKFSCPSFDSYEKFDGGCPPTQPPTQKFKIRFSLFSSQEIGSSLISFQMIFKAPQSEVFRSNFNSLS